MVVTYVDVPKPGQIYQHYKGDLYRVLHVATASNGCREGETVIVYEGVKWSSGENVRVRSLHGKDGWDEWGPEIGPGELVNGRYVYPKRFTHWPTPNPVLVGEVKERGSDGP
jgi:hypothetical protein